MNEAPDTTEATVEELVEAALDADHAEGRILRRISRAADDIGSYTDDARRAAVALQAEMTVLIDHLDAGVHASTSSAARTLEQALADREAAAQTLRQLIHCIADDDLRIDLMDAR